jgi:hypothetical protein
MCTFGLVKSVVFAIVAPVGGQLLSIGPQGRGAIMAHDVFLSYSSKDKPIADAVCGTLEGKRIRCWIAPRDVLPGLPYGEALVEAIESSRVMVLVFSSNANNSPQVMREVERAVSKGIPIIPLRIEQVPPSKSLEYFISAPHWLDALTPPLEKHLQSLAETVHLLLARYGERCGFREGETGPSLGTVAEAAGKPYRPPPAAPEFPIWDELVASSRLGTKASGGRPAARKAAAVKSAAGPKVSPEPAARIAIEADDAPRRVKPKSKKGLFISCGIGAAVLFLACGVTIFVAVKLAISEPDQGSMLGHFQQKTPPVPAGPPIFTDQQLYERLLHSVVWIYGEDKTGTNAWTGCGGVVHVGRRLIITTRHVVEPDIEGGKVGKLMVLFPQWEAKEQLINDKKHYSDLLKAGKGQTASVLRSDKDRGLAVIQLEGALPKDTEAIKVAPWRARTGDHLVSVSRPGASSAAWSLIAGSVRSPLEEVRHGEMLVLRAKALENDLPTNPGDSGSPVVVIAHCPFEGQAA